VYEKLNSSLTRECGASSMTSGARSAPRARDDERDSVGTRRLYGCSAYLRPGDRHGLDMSPARSYPISAPHTSSEVRTSEKFAAHRSLAHLHHTHRASPSAAGKPWHVAPASYTERSPPPAAVLSTVCGLQLHARLCEIVGHIVANVQQAFVISIRG